MHSRAGRVLGLRWDAGAPEAPRTGLVGTSRRRETYLEERRRGLALCDAVAAALPLHMGSRSARSTQDTDLFGRQDTIGSSTFYHAARRTQFCFVLVWFVVDQSRPCVLKCLRGRL